MSRALFNASPEIRRRLSSEFVPVASERVVRFRAIAEGQAWGTKWSVYHGRSDPSDPNGYLRPTLAPESR